LHSLFGCAIIFLENKRKEHTLMDSYMDSYYATTPTLADATMASAISGIFSTIAIFMVIWYVLIVVAQWKIFTKAGEAGWKCLIPVYNLVILFKISGLSPWLILVYLLSIIPVVGGIISLVLTIVLWNKLSQAFGHGAGFTVGLLFLNPIFMMILGFGSSEYVGQKA